jgi:hypothetical protein
MAVLDAESRLARVGAALLGAAASGVVAALVDMTYLARGVPDARLVLSGIGLVAPLALAIGGLVALLRLALLPAWWPRFGAPLTELGNRALAEKQTLASRLLVAPILALLIVVLAARVALRLLASSEPVLGSGAALGLATAALFGLAVIATVGFVVPGRARVLAENPVRVGAGALAVAAGSFLALVALGTTSGAGGTLAVFGVFKRQELDLRGVTLAFVMAAGALFSPGLRRRSAWVASLLLALAPLLALPYTATIGLDAKLALEIERRAPLGKRLLAAYQKVSDRDGDGASAWFAGGDCAEGNPEIGPSRDDVPGNGVDEDCSGEDAVSLAPRVAAPRPAGAEELLERRLPKKPNVVLITIDALRAELGYTGYSRPISPSIDALAAKSAVFENAYALASYTSKSLGPSSDLIWAWRCGRRATIRRR